MADDFSLNDALSGASQAPTQNSEGQAWPGAPWNQNPAAGQPYPGFPGAPGQPYPGYPGAPGAQQTPGYPGAPGAQQTPGYPGAPGAQQTPGYPGAPGAQQTPGYPGAPGAQQTPGYPGAPGAQPYQGYPGFPYGGPGGPGQPFPGFPSSGQQFPGAPTPGQPGPGTVTPSTPGLPAPTGPVKVPFHLPLLMGIANRLMVTIQGTVPDKPKRFNIDFMKGSDIAFHFNPRYEEWKKVVVRNTMIKDQWGPEERETPTFPFKPGHQFKLQVLCEPDQYVVLVNDELLCKYRHRVPDLNEIKSMCIKGDIVVANVSVSRP